MSGHLQAIGNDDHTVGQVLSGPVLELPTQAGCNMTAWIEMIADDDADAAQSEALELARTPHGTVDNVMRVHALRPSTMTGHVTLYRSILHDDRNTLPAWLQETIGSYVSMLNSCEYSFANHWANARHLIGDKARADRIETAMMHRKLATEFSEAEHALLEYAAKLTEEPGGMTRQDVARLKDLGWDDGQILEANQITSYFAYANRLLNGLGVTTEGDVIGYYSES